VSNPLDLDAIERACESRDVTVLSLIAECRSLRVALAGERLIVQAERETRERAERQRDEARAEVDRLRNVLWRRYHATREEMHGAATPGAS